MKKVSLILLSASAFIFTNCTQQEIDAPINETCVLNAVMEDVGQTKSDATDEGVFTWSQNDTIYVQTTEGFRVGTLIGEGGTASASFGYTLIGEEEETGYAVYPYNESHNITSEAIKVVLPASYELGATLRNTNAIMLASPANDAAVVDESKTNTYRFQHLAGVMRFKFENVPAGVDRFELSLGGAKINGEFVVADAHIATATTEVEAEKATSLTFDALKERSDITLFVPVPVGTYTGANLAFYAGETEIWSYESSKTNTVARKNLVRMPVVKISSSEGTIVTEVGDANALKAAIAAGGEVVLSADIELSEILTVEKNVVLDLNGHTLSYTSEVAGEPMITNKASLTINDSGDAGKITYTFAGEPTTAKAANVISNMGAVVVNGGEITNTGKGNQIGYVVDNYNGSTLTVNGGQIAAAGSSYYDGIRLFCGTNEIVVTVNGGQISSIWAQNPSNNKASVVNGTVVINGGNVTATYYENYTVVKVKEGVEAKVTAYSTCSEFATLNVVDGYTVYSFAAPVAVVLKDGKQVYCCHTIEDAISKASADESGTASVKLLADVNAAGLITIPADKTLVLDLNGHAFAYTSAVAGDAMITNNGTLTVKDSGLNGKITYSYTGTPDTSYGKGNYTIFNKGTLTLESGIVENTTAAMSHASYAINTDTGATVTINGGKVLNLNAHSIRMTSFATGANKVTVNGGYVEGTRAIQLHLPGSNSSSAPEMSLAINGGELKSNENVYNMAVYLTSSGQSCENVSINVTGGTLNGNIALAKLATNSLQDNAVKISGGVLNGPWGIYSWATDDVAKNKINITGGTFASMMPLAYMTDGEKADFKLMEDYVAYEGLDIPKGVDVKVDLNGNDISYAVDNDGKASAIFKNNGTLTLVNSASAESMISFIANDPDLQQVPSYATNTISNFGTLTIGRNVVVTNESEGGASYAVDNHAYFTLDGGTLLGKRCALRIAKFNPPYVSFTMNSGLVKAATPAWIHLPGSDSAVAPSIDVNIKGGKFETTKESSKDNNIFYTYSYGNSHANTKITISGGEFVGGTVSIGSGYKGDSPTLNITGGSFDYDVLQWLENDEVNVLYPASNN